MKAKSNPSQALFGGLILILIGGAVWGIGDLLANSITILIGVLLFLGGILLFFGGITRYLDKL